MNRLITLDDLYNYISTYCGKKKMSHFGMADSDHSVVVQIPATLRFEGQDGNTEGLVPVTLQSNHIGKNRNGSYIAREVQEKALDSFKNRPILAYIHEVDGQMEFGGHNMHLGDKGELIYDEVPIGIIPESCSPRLVSVEGYENEFVEVNGYLFDGYSRAVEILNREKTCSVSIEIVIRDMDYDTKTGVLNIGDFYYAGVTVLGKDGDGSVIEPGMEHANITLGFSDGAEQVKREVGTETDAASFNIDMEKSQSSKEGGNGMAKIQELLEKYNKTDEDITFETEGLSDDELEAKFKEAFEPETEVQEETTVVTEPAGEVELHLATTVDGAVVREGTLEIDRDDIRYELYKLILTGRDDDGYPYIIDVTDTDFIVHDIDEGGFYGYAYTVTDGIPALAGERYAVFPEFMTDQQKQELDEMRESTPAMAEELASLKKERDHNSKEEILSDEYYKNYLDSDEFKELRENMDSYSVDDFKVQTEMAFAKCVRKEVKPSGEAENVSKKHTFFSARKEAFKDPYNGLFSEEELRNEENK